MTKKTIHSLYLLMLFAFFACKKLTRDNPIDLHNNTGKCFYGVKFDHYVLESWGDSNGDRIISKGETITLNLFAKNNNCATATGLLGTITCDSPWANIKESNLHFGSDELVENSITTYHFYYRIKSGVVGYTNPDRSLTFGISKDCPIGTDISFNLDIPDDNGAIWNSTFSVKVLPTNAKLKFSRYQVYADDNSDKHINPGEKITLKLFILNTGSGSANKVHANILCANTNVSDLVSANNISYYSNGDLNDISIRANAVMEAWPSSTSDYFGFKVSPNALPGSTITFSVLLSDDCANTWIDEFTVPVE